MKFFRAKTILTCLAIGTLCPIAFSQFIAPPIWSTTNGGSFSWNFLTSPAVPSLLTFTRGSSASHYNSSGTIVSVGNNVARFDYDPTTLQPKGWLMEPARTNTVHTSEVTNTGDWTPTGWWWTLNCTMAGDVINAPDGTLTADSCAEIDTAVDDQHVVGYTDADIPASTVATFSAFVKPNTITAVNAYVVDYNSINADVVFHLTGNGTATLNGSGNGLNGIITDYGIQKLPNSWYRIYVIYNSRTGGAGNVNIFLRSFDTALNTSWYDSGASNRSFYVWGFQNEIGNGLSSYIKTAGADVTRSADQAVFNSMTWFNPNTGTLFAQYINGATESANLYRTFGLFQTNVAGTFADNSIELSDQNVTNTSRLTSGGTPQFTPVGTVNDARLVNKAALAYTTNNHAFSLNGSAPLTATTGTIPSSIAFGYIGSQPDGLSRPKWIQKISYYKQKLNDPLLQQLTENELSAQQIVENLGLETSHVLCLDAGASASYDGTSQTWKDLSATGADYYRGTTSGANATDPTFAGTAGAASENEYFSFDGGDYFTPVAATTFDDGWHKDNATSTVALVAYIPSASSVYRVLVSNGESGVNTQAYGLIVSNTNILQLGIVDGTAPTFYTWGNISTIADRFSFIGISHSEGGGASGSHWNVNGAITTFNGTVATPSASNPNFSLRFGTTGNAGGDIVENGTRYAVACAWNRALSQGELETFRRSIMERYAPAQARIILTAGSTWTVPTDWNSNDNSIEVIGGGGGGAASKSSYDGTGGGGGAYAKINNLYLLAGSSVTYAIGGGGTAGAAAGFAGSGGDSYFNGASCGAASVCGKGGVGGGVGGLNVAGTGGLASNSIGTVKYSGGSARFSRRGWAGTGGGGAAGPNGAGKNGSRDNGSDINTDPGGAGGGSNGGTAAVDAPASTGGVGGNNFLGTIGGAGGLVAGASGTSGTLGAGGGGGDGNGAGVGGNGGAGGSGVEWDNTHGSGGGGGAGAGGSTTGGTGGAGGLYGGGGGGGSTGTVTNADGGAGAQGIVVITYTPTNERTVVLTAGTSWTVPADFNSANNSIEVIGGGGGGGRNTTVNGGGGGGGGGGYSKVSNAVLPVGASVTVAIGTGGPPESTGGDTYLCNSTSNCANISGTAVVVGAKGGGLGLNSGGAGGAGGPAASGKPAAGADRRHSGGTGGSSGTDENGGGGGGAAGGPASNGSAGGSSSATCGSAGGGGGGANGGTNGISVTGGLEDGGNGGVGPFGTAGGIGGVWNASGTPGGIGSNGSGGGGGSSNCSGGTGDIGGNGGSGTDIVGSIGAGGGGGAGGSEGGNNGGTGGSYGGGGGGGGAGTGTSAGGSGAQGVIVIKYNAIDPCAGKSIGSACSGTPALYAGVFDGGKYMITPGGCDQPLTSCSGGTDAQDNTWYGSGGSNVDIAGLTNLAGIATPSPSSERGHFATPLIANSANVTADSAVEYCQQATYGGFSDWYLPSKSEMAYLYCRAAGVPSHSASAPEEDPDCASIGGKTSQIPGFNTSTNYLVSSETTSANTFIQYFGTGGQSLYAKGSVARLRCIRRY